MTLPPDHSDMLLHPSLTDQSRRLRIAIEADRLGFCWLASHPDISPIQFDVQPAMLENMLSSYETSKQSRKYNQKYTSAGV